MRIDGQWLLCEDGVIRPTLHGELETGGTLPLQVEFLIDSGADRTVLDAATFAQLALPPLEAPETVSGLGGATETVLVETVIHLRRETGQAVGFRGQFTAVTEAAGLECNVLRRDIMDLFAVIIDRPSKVVSLLSQKHQYTIIQQP